MEHCTHVEATTIRLLQPLWLSCRVPDLSTRLFAGRKLGVTAPSPSNASPFTTLLKRAAMSLTGNNHASWSRHGGGSLRRITCPSPPRLFDTEEIREMITAGVCRLRAREKPSLSLVGHPHFHERLPGDVEGSIHVGLEVVDQEEEGGRGTVATNPVGVFAYAGVGQTSDRHPTCPSLQEPHQHNCYLTGGAGAANVVGGALQVCPIMCC
jgi:hypothetical protein